MTQAMQPLHKFIPNCISASVEQGRFTLIFRTAKAADAFDALFQALLKANEVMGRHCSVYIPQGYESWKAYKSELGVKNLLAYDVQFDVEFTASDLAEQIKALYAENTDPGA